MSSVYANNRMTWHPLKNKFPLRSHGTSLGAIYSFGSLGFRLFILFPFPSF